MSLSETLLLSTKSRLAGDYEWLPDNLLLSSPDADGQGGLFYLPKTRWFRAGTITVVDRFATAALWREPSGLFRSMQDNACLWITVHENGGRVWHIYNSELTNVHDMLMLDGELYIVSTGTNEVARISGSGVIEQKWTFPGGPNSWHVNGLCIWDGRLVVSARGRFGAPLEYLKNSSGTGIVFDLMTGDTLMSGLSGPHTPRMDSWGRKLLCDSITSRVLVMGPGNNPQELLFEGTFPRGLAWGKDHIYVGLNSLMTPEGTPKTRDRAQIAILDSQSLKVVAKIQLPMAEVYDILVLNEPD